MIVNFFIGLISSIIFSIILTFIEVLTRRRNYSAELTRKIAHLLSGIFGIAMAFVLYPAVFITFTILFAIVISFSYRAKWFKSIHSVGRKTFGEIFFPLGILTAYIVSGGPTPIYLSSLLILTIADPLSGGIRAKRSIQNKTLVSFLSFWGSTLTILFLIFYDHQFPLLVFISFTVSLVESISPLGIDNLSIPLSNSLLLIFLL